MSLYNNQNFVFIPPNESPPGFPDTTTASCSWVPTQEQATSSSSTTPSATAIEVKPKRKRTAYSTNQLNALEEQYSKTRYLERNRRFELAAELDVTERNIKIWFQNRRMKDKKEEDNESVHSTSVTSSLGPILFPDLSVPLTEQYLVPNEAVTADWVPMPSTSNMTCDYYGSCVVQESANPLQPTPMQFAVQSPVVTYPHSDYRTAYNNNLEYGYTVVPQNSLSEQCMPSQEVVNSESQWFP